MELEKVRLAYELAIGKRCSDNHWYRTRQLMRLHQLEVNVTNVQLFAELRRTVPRSQVGIGGLLECYREADKLLKVSKSLKGAEVLALLKQFDCCPHQTTVSRWFRNLGGYRRDRDYSPEQLRPIFTAAFIYKAQHSTKLPEAN